MFRITSGKGFHITFPNGVTLSTQIGWGNYCSNYGFKGSYEEMATKNSWESHDCEIAIWNKDGNWITNKIVEDCDQVKGYIEIEEWLKIFDKCKRYKK